MDLSFAVLLLSANSSNFERLRRSKQQALRNKESMLLVAYRNLSMPPQQSVSIGIKNPKPTARMNICLRPRPKRRLQSTNFVRCDLLERALDVRLADEQVADARAAVEHHAAIQARLDVVSGERAAFAGQRAKMTLPKPGALAPMRRLAIELAAARGALDIGFVVTVSPNGRLGISIRKDGTPVESTSTERSFGTKRIGI
jgi:hypothetical protein